MMEKLKSITYHIEDWFEYWVEKGGITGIIMVSISFFSFATIFVLSGIAILYSTVIVLSAGFWKILFPVLLGFFVYNLSEYVNNSKGD